MTEAEAREIVRKRANGRCEVCGGRGSEYSHRQRRSIQANRWDPANALLACRSCHARMHNSPQEARTVGWHVSIYEEPAQVPVLLSDGHYWLLDHEGGATEVVDPQP